MQVSIRRLAHGNHTHTLTHPERVLIGFLGTSTRVSESSGNGGAQPLQKRAQFDIHCLFATRAHLIVNFLHLLFIRFRLDPIGGNADIISVAAGIHIAAPGKVIVSLQDADQRVELKFDADCVAQPRARTLREQGFTIKKVLGRESRPWRCAFVLV